MICFIVVISVICVGMAVWIWGHPPAQRDTTDYKVYNFPSPANRFQVLERITLEVNHKGPGEYTAYVSPEDYKFVSSTVIPYGIDPNYYSCGCVIELLGSKVYIRPHRDCPECEVFVWGGKHVRD